MSTLKSMVDSHLTRHFYRDEDPVGTCLCGSPPKGVSFDDPAPNLDPEAIYVNECDSCYAVREAIECGAIKYERAILAHGTSSDDELLKRMMTSHHPPPDPLTAPWSELVER